MMAPFSAVETEDKKLIDYLSAKPLDVAHQEQW
jgi:hypothetical protein